MRSAARPPPSSRSSNTVLASTLTRCPSSVKALPLKSSAPTRPLISLSKRMRLALALEPLVPVLMAELSTSTVMPRRSSSRERRPPSPSSTAAALSSKRTPPTMTEPKPVIGPAA